MATKDRNGRELLNGLISCFPKKTPLYLKVQEKAVESREVDK